MSAGVSAGATGVAGGPGRAAAGLRRRRQIANGLGLGFAVAATLVGLAFLFWILGATLVNGFAALGPRLLTEMTPPPGAEGGLLNALYGSFIMIVVGTLVGTPIGVMAGTWLAEYGALRPLAEATRFLNDILLSAPSIVIGLFVYELVVQPTGHFSGWAGAVALAVILLPIVVRTSDETLRLVPTALREATLALGAPRWRMIASVLWPAARTGITTGILLAIARISGETAPLLFTALNNQFWTWNPASPMANVPVVIFQYALSPYATWHELAWAGALIMTLVVLVVSVGARYAIRSRS
jgi:phosphate transport system permease protein